MIKKNWLYLKKKGEVGLDIGANLMNASRKVNSKLRGLAIGNNWRRSVGAGGSKARA